ncbi:MAG: hypothetical protein ACKO7W_13435, partial [Elainella sp.]
SRFQGDILADIGCNLPAHIVVFLPAVAPLLSVSSLFDSYRIYSTSCFRKAGRLSGYIRAELLALQQVGGEFLPSRVTRISFSAFTLPLFSTSLQ